MLTIVAVFKTLEH